ncbi:thioredoxin domain-containing protein [Aliifodinibius sp. S!AR15-10]|uniref:vitamin K epoxide reductase family protein n=1 Tax=Aliifodinibius sp. S!AR15-10 TaxID=2950437 RepID=UPI002855CF35|nr:vitamin K epoxide reductase family protein [Aliifodinibius sp. S!AR15-10]MDR8393838.1 thioredoxin domain-containing protein [Aliifodinibius sp. S!AR15-10]
MEQIVSNYLEYLNIPISTTYCEKRIRSHPEYPSLLSIADTLDRLGIPYQAARVKINDLFELEYPFLLQPAEGNSELVLVKGKGDLEQVNEEKQQSHGVVLQAEPVESIADEQNKKYRARESSSKKLKSVLLAAATGLMLLPVFQLGSGILIVLHMLATMGATVGYLLLAKDLGITYEPVEQFCNSGKNTSCDSVLQSEEARIFGDITFSDAVGIYFLSQLVITGYLLPFIQGISSLVLALSVLSALTIPVVGYSLYYQWQKARVWCRLCLAVDSVLIAEVALFGYIYFNNGILFNEITLVPVLLIFFIFGAVGPSLVLIKNRLQDAGALERTEEAYHRLKHAPSVFTHLFLQEERVDTTPFEKELLLGNPDAPVKITMASNLFCGPCGLQHQDLTRLIDAFPERVCASIRLFRSSKSSSRMLKANRYLLAYWLEHIYGKPDGYVQTEKLLQEWYSFMDMETFKEQYPMEGEISEETEKLEAEHYKWKEKVQISRTPTFFVNGYPLPNQYRLTDIKDLMPGLADLLASRKESRNATPSVQKV